jgi:hypothetical protein
MFELTSLQPFVIGFFVLAGVVTAFAVATLARVLAEVRQSHTAAPVVSIAGRSAAVATGRAA